MYPLRYRRECNTGIYAWAYGSNNHIHWLFAQEYYAVYVKQRNAEES